MNLIRTKFSNNDFIDLYSGKKKINRINGTLNVGNHIKVEKNVLENEWQQEYRLIYNSYILERKGVENEGR